MAEMEELEFDVPETDEVGTDEFNEPEVEVEATEDYDIRDDAQERLLSKYNINLEDATTETLIRTLERLEKAEKSLVENKKKAKSTPVVNNPGDFVTKQDWEVIRFIDKNPEFEGQEDKIKTYLKKGLDLEEEIPFLLKKNPTLLNREKTKETSFAFAETSGSGTTYTQEQMAKMPPEKAQRVWQLVKQGKARVK